MLQHLQNWFERMLGVARLEREMHQQAWEIYQHRELPATLQLPACWRRQSRVRLSR
ncbi:MAG: hypothetical protein LBQ81_08685 [Zoogloeaceae bacterium]|jgi:hypothetical protein|nr:hypothetical protein [Zoogloeaceae bacterium]